MFQNNKGFTMIEVLFAITLIGIALIPIMQVMPSFYRTNREMINENTLAFLAQQKIEEVKSSLINNFSATISPLSDTFSSDDFADGVNYHFIIGNPSNPSIPSQPKDNPDGSRANLVVVSVQVWYCYGSTGSYDAAENKIQLITKIASRS